WLGAGRWDEPVGSANRGRVRACLERFEVVLSGQERVSIASELARRYRRLQRQLRPPAAVHRGSWLRPAQRHGHTERPRWLLTSLSRGRSLGGPFLSDRLLHRVEESVGGAALHNVPEHALVLEGLTSHRVA